MAPRGTGNRKGKRIPIKNLFAGSFLPSHTESMKIKNTDTYTAKHLTADLTMALEGYMDIHDISYRQEGTFEELGIMTDNEGIVVQVEGRRFKIKVIPA